MIGGILAGQAIAQAGVKCVYTLCGGHVAPIYIGLKMSGVDIVDMRHEAAAAHAADAYGRLTGVPGVAIVTAGPGITNAVTGIANAYEAESPMVVIGGKVGMARLNQASLQEMDQLALMDSITKWRECVYDTARIPEYLARAFHIASTGRRGPVFLEIPIDLLLQQAESKHPGPAPVNPDEGLSLPNPADIETLAGWLNEAKKPVIMGGAAIHWDNAHEALDAFARQTGIPIYLNGLGRGTLPSTHPNFCSRTRKKALSSGDLIITLGADADFRLGYGRGFNPDAKVVQVDPDAFRVRFNVQPDLFLIGNARLTLQHLTKALSGMAPKTDWLEELRAQEDVALDGLKDELESDIYPVNPNRFGNEVAKVVDADTIVVGDGGNIVAATSKFVPLFGPGRWMDPGKFGCLGVGMPFAIAAQQLNPDKKVLVVFGDGSVGFNGFEIDTAVRFKMPIVGIVGNDAAWTQIRAAQLEAAGEEFAVATQLAPTRYDQFCVGLGGLGYHVESADQIAPTLEKAFEEARAQGKPAIINVPVDADLNGRGVSYIAAGMA
ncbi:MAG: hypothetical protein H6684_00835 [Deltaproteobacteria bacterium]|nr:hypothetical protein [bacterium]MCB9478193.1 hypothetical protein [Deltaproteobacteria bacterium]MCB9487255.1 hypothetical protein [Deltaproteobacteria bacterium]